MFAKPQDEHRWLEQWVGTWVSESECIMGPDQPPNRTSGRVVSRSLGGLWNILEGEGESPDRSWQSIITLGYDPDMGHFVGTFVASMMARLWIYSGALNPTKRRLVLDATNPKNNNNKKKQKQNNNKNNKNKHWRLLSQILGDDGVWH